MTIIEDRAAILPRLKLYRGAHSFDPGRPVDEQELCIMEAVAWLAGEPHSDRPKCASPTIAAFCRRWQDDLAVDGVVPDEDARWFLSLAPRLVGSRGTKAQEEQRAWMAADWLVHTSLPLWLRAAGMDEQAVACEALPPIDSRAVWLHHAASLRSLRDATWPRRHSFYRTIREAVREAVQAEPTRRGHAAEVAVAAVEEAEVAVAVEEAAAAVAEVTVAAAAAAACDVAVAEVAVAEVAVAVAVAAVAVAEVAVAVAAVAAADWSDYWAARAKIREAVRAAVRSVIEATLDEKLPGARAGAKASARDLVERMLAVTEARP